MNVKLNAFFALTVCVSSSTPYTAVFTKNVYHNSEPNV